MTDTPSEILNEVNKIFFFAIESKSTTSVKDINDMCVLLEEICPRYNMKWCQAKWRDTMVRIEKVKQ